ncbi:MAG: PD-(D/E)XK nuclease family protein, partial [Chloroflexi bacterium]|nr:PD-(D/E)XK nuclease family protein [Chloroflexota bacterium]
ILEQVYGDAQVTDPANLEQLLAALPAVAGRVLDAAPAQEGFRETAWWQHTRQEIVQNVRRTLERLADLPGDYLPWGQEVRFFGPQRLQIEADGEVFGVHGVIDRVDRAADGCLRVVDYKTAGPSAFGPGAVHEGKKLQLPLYALAAREALGLGEPAEGFYWHVQQGEASGFSLASFPGGPLAAMEMAVAAAWKAVQGARQGRFSPHPPDEGCPSYCPAAAFCWHRHSRGG